MVGIYGAEHPAAHRTQPRHKNTTGAAASATKGALFPIRERRVGIRSIETRESIQRILFRIPMPYLYVKILRSWPAIIAEPCARYKKTMPKAIATPTPRSEPIGVGVAIGITFEKTIGVHVWLAKNYLANVLNHRSVIKNGTQLELMFLGQQFQLNKVHETRP